MSGPRAKLRVMSEPPVPLPPASPQSAEPPVPPGPPVPPVPPVLPADRSGPFWDYLAGRVPPAPAAATLGWTLRRVDAERGEIEIGFTAREEFANPLGSVQGGFLAAMLDDTLGPALATTLEPDQFAVTLDLNVSYLRPAAPGPVTGTGRVVHRGGSIAFLAGELRNAAGEVLATATATARIIRPAPGLLASAAPGPGAS
jgi:uncharacterized protein (TIGR00369 family)